MKEKTYYFLEDIIKHFYPDDENNIDNSDRKYLRTFILYARGYKKKSLIILTTIASCRHN